MTEREEARTETRERACPSPWRRDGWRNGSTTFTRPFRPSYLPKVSFFLYLSLPLFRHPIRRSLHPSPHTTRPFHSRKPLRRYPLPRTGNHRLELRARCLEPREGSVGAPRARRATPLRSGRSCGLDLSKLTGFIPPTRLVNRYGIAYRNGRFDVSLFPPV